MEDTEYMVYKASGEQVPFEADKLIRSLVRAGADEQLAEEIAEKIKAEMHDGMSTRKIYKQAFKYLKKKQHGLAARYSLKQAILELGPAGYPFEKFIARLLSYQGFEVDTNLVLNGKCVSHEVDVRAFSDNMLLFVECKYHTDQGRKSDIKTALYFHSRFEDLSSGVKGKYLKVEKDGWLITNTRFSNDAVKYGQCMNMSLISWEQPRDNALKEMVERSGLHPVTCLTTLTRDEKRQLIADDILLCRELNEDLLGKIIGTGKRLKSVMDEVLEICLQK